MIERLLAADAALDRGELDHAGRVYAQVAEADTRNAIALVGLARVALARGDRNEARSLLERALRIDPDEAAARRLLDEVGTAMAAATTESAPASAEERSSRPKLPRSWWRRWLDRILGRG